jgi:hypothetical protein
LLATTLLESVGLRTIVGELMASMRLAPWMMTLPLIVVVRSVVSRRPAPTTAASPQSTATIASPLRLLMTGDCTPGLHRAVVAVPSLDGNGASRHPAL